MAFLAIGTRPAPLRRRRPRWCRTGDTRPRAGARGTSSIQSRREYRVRANCAGESSITTTWPMPAAVAPPPIGPGSTTTTDSPAAAQRQRAGGAHDAAADDDDVDRSGSSRGSRRRTGRAGRGSGRLGIDVGRAGDARDDLAVHDATRALEDAADDALLPPDLALAAACRRRTGRRAWRWCRCRRRAVVGLAGAEDEVAAVGAGRGRRAEELDVVDLAAVGAGDALRVRAPGGCAR